MWLEELGNFQLGLIVMVSFTIYCFFKASDIVNYKKYSNKHVSTLTLIKFITWSISTILIIYSLYHFKWVILVISIVSLLIGTYFGNQFKKWFNLRNYKTPKPFKTKETTAEDSEILKIKDCILDNIDEFAERLLKDKETVFKYDKDRQMVDIYFTVRHASRENEVNRNTIYRSINDPFKTNINNYYYVRRKS